ncbi:MAG: glycosyltransferase [Gemmataceae bacterium]|nr:glycosyltransferase [Gemmataceae bacterium]
MEDVRVIFVHDWLTGTRGGEKCLEPLARRFPSARLYTLIHEPGRVPAAIEHLRPKTSALQRLPRVSRYYRYLLPVMPLAAGWQLPECDLVLSFSHCVAKSARPPAGVPHVCYCFTPMRYAWQLREAYFGRSWRAKAADWLLDRLRDWDRATAPRVSHFIAVSETVRDRIRVCYGRDSVVIYPPVDTDFFTPSDVPREDFYLCVSALAPYKRLDLAIEACSRLGKRLIVIGTGQDQRRLRSLAGPGIQLLGWQPDDVIRDHYRRCRALLFPGEEDFGIVPVEAQACGAPVIAYGKGGAIETVVEPGGFFEEQTVESLCEAIRDFERRGTGDCSQLRKQAERFSRKRYEEEMVRFLGNVLQEKRPRNERSRAKVDCQR